jgi:hypothetical protein
MMCLMLAGLEMTTGLVPAAYASGPGGNVSDPVVRAVDIAKPAVVRIFTLVVSQLTVTFANGNTVTFPQTPQDGFNGYPLQLSGSGAFISAHGDILTADHVINPVQDDKTAMDQFLDQTASQDVANFINRNSQQQVTPDQVTQELVSGQLRSTPIYQKPQSQVFRSTDYSGPISATSFQQLPASQFANVDQIKASSPFSQFDTAIIHVSTMNDMPMLQLGDSSTVQTQDQLTIIGFPGNGDVNNSPNDILTSSINVIQVSSIKTTPSGAPLIQVGGNVEQGDSGGPALDSTGQIVGIVSFGTSTTGGGTSFLRASSSAKQMIQQAGIDITSSPFQKAWKQAFTDYSSTAAGHWHQSVQEFQQLADQYPQFKAVTPFLQYATQQAQNEPQTSTTQRNNNQAAGSPGGLNPVMIIILGLVLLVIVVFGGSFLVSRSRQQKLALSNGAASPTMPPSYFGTPGQSYGTLPANAPGMAQPGAPVPQTPAYPGQTAFAQFGQAPTQMPSPAPQPAYRPQPSAPQPAFWPQQPAQSAVNNSMTAFGAPAAPGALPATPQPQPSDSTRVASPGTALPQWRIWPCGHTNRFDSSFCGTCGESAPPAPLVRRPEQ